MIEFFKYQGTGNDFILIDCIQIHPALKLNEQDISRLCDRHFGIGADGLMLLAPSEDYDFKMVYFNSDGKRSSMCGNGGRCIAAFAKRQGYVHDACSFEAADGAHTAVFLENNIVKISMNDVGKISCLEDYCTLDTGSPHFIKWINSDPEKEDIEQIGRSIRYSKEFKDEGINVNIVQVKNPNTLFMRTYERGVERETLSCGTGVTAAAIAHAYTHIYPGSKNTTSMCEQKINISTRGGSLSVSFTYEREAFTNIWLEGPVDLVFRGYTKLPKS